MANKDKGDRAARYTGLRKGLTQLWGAHGPLVLGGKRWTVPQMLAVLASMLDAIKAADQAYVAYRAKVAQRRAIERQWRTFVAQLNVMIQTEYGEDLGSLAVFGVTPMKKPGPKTLSAKVGSAAKAKATSAASTGSAAAGKTKRRRG